MEPSGNAAGSTYDVTEDRFGATGDGTSNDREAIQAAINTASRQGGGTVLLPAGHTFLSGNLLLGDRTTLRIDGVLRQSQAPEHLTFRPLYGHRKPGEHQSHITWFDNLPFVFATRCREVTITGSGSIEMTHAEADRTEFPNHRDIGTDHNTIHMVPIALYEVAGFEVSDVKVFYGNTHNILIYSCRDGAVRNTRVEVYPDEESFGRHHVANTDAVQVMHSQNVRITGNHFDQIDNTVVVIARHADPREPTAWWSSANPQPTRNVEIDHNFIKTSHGGVVFLPWAPSAPDLSEVEISDVRIHHNTIDVGIQPLEIRADYVYDPGPSEDSHSPIKEVAVHHNTYASIARHSRRLTRRARITNLVGDFHQLSHPTFLNSAFQHKLAYWSTSGDAGWVDADRPGALIHDDAQAAAADAGGATRLGFIQTQPGDAALYQGLGLVDGLRYRFRARIAARGHGTRLFVRNTCADTTVAELIADQPGWADYELTFRADGTCGCYHVGLDRRATDDGWALVDWMRLDSLGEVIEVDDPRIRYAGTWREFRDVNLVGRAYAETTEPGASATVSFNGTRATWFGLRDWVYGRGEVQVDGVPAGTVDGFNDGSWPAWVDHQVLFDTGTREPGPHTICLTCSGDRREGALGIGMALDAVVVDPA